MTGCVVAMVTVPNIQEGRVIARALVERGLAACVNIIPEVHSIYRWQGDIEEDTESKLMIKTTSVRVCAMIEAVRDLHSYDVCEVTVIDVVGGNEPYLQWIQDSVAE